MAVPIWNENSKSYKIDVKPDIKDEIFVEVGDSQDPTTFHPQAKICRWGNLDGTSEANVSFRLIHDFIPGVKITNDEQNGVITWTKKVGSQEWIARFYEDWGTPEGAYKFVELVLPAKPPTNQISFTTQSKDVDFFYQPPLTPEEIAEGAIQPDDVVGSYAIYSKSSGGMNEAGGKDYKVGKVGHLYRPKFIDANGAEFWGEYNTDLNDTGILTITANQADLDNAVYPLIMDPTFGYTTMGATFSFETGYLNNDTSVHRGLTFSLAEVGTLDKISVGLKAQTASESADHYVGIWREDSAGTSSHNLVVGIERENLTVSTTADWYDFTASSEELTTDDYILGIIGNGYELVSGSVYIARDATTSRNTYYETYTGSSGYSTAKSEEPWTEDLYSSTSTQSIYATYTASGGGDVSASSSDTSTTSDSVTVSLSRRNISVFDKSTLSGNPATGRAGAGVAKPTDTSTLSDSITSKAGTDLASTNSTSTVDDSATASRVDYNRDATSSSTSTLDDSITSKAGSGVGEVQDTSTTSDAVSAQSGNATANVSDTSTVGDEITAQAGSALAVVADTSTLDDSATAETSSLPGEPIDISITGWVDSPVKVV